MSSNEEHPPQDSRGLQDGSTVPRLAEIVRRLLAPDGCPWDREQTLQTLRPFVVEEAYEVLDAIESGSPDDLREELGDLLMQIVFQCKLTERQGWFGLDDVVAGISEKLIRRHPHVFGDAQVSGTEQVLVNWEKLKAAEKKGRGLLDSLPRSLPALLRALRVGEKAARVGYDWPDLSGVRAKVDEELAELDVALAAQEPARVEEELGDVLFALASLARKRGVDPEAALRGTLDRFTARVQAAEALARAQGTTLPELDDVARDALWERVKRGS